MPFIEYILLGLLGAGGAAVLDGVPPGGGLTLGSDAVVQPNGGVMESSAQAGPKKQACDAGSKDAARIRTAMVKRKGRSHAGRGRRYKATHQITTEKPVKG